MTNRVRSDAGVLDPDLAELLHAAVQGLQGEDAALATAFEGATGDLRRFYCEANHGLAYWVFETQLVYTIFKAWLPRVPIAWESPAYGDARKADLVVFNDDRSRRWVFEAKWWNRDWRTDPKQKSAIDEDLKKLLAAEAEERFELAFSGRGEASRRGQ